MPAEALCGPAVGAGGRVLAGLVMTALMMGPAALPLALRHRPLGARLGAVAGYAGVCLAAGAAAMALAAPAPWGSGLAAAALAGAGAFQLSGAKVRALAACRGALAAPANVRSGARYGVLCLVSCGPAMLALSAAGAMSWAVSLAVGGVILTEKALGAPAARLGGLALFGGAGALLALA